LVPPADSGAVARELVRLARAFGDGLAAGLTQQQAERIRPYAALGLAAMIHDVPGLADFARASAAELAAAVAQDPDPVLQTLAEVLREL
ncbi:MAG: hypothetical protein HUK26_06990, partial [Duodenibacillus sp.]|nr:hypothetical protein [Duodenibacillus sp.]